MGRPSASASSAATKESSSVAGIRSTISFDTGCTWRRLRPNSPLHEERPVEAEIAPPLLALLFGGVLAAHVDHRIADEAEQRERDQPDGQHDEDRLPEAPQDEREHSLPKW
jgi:hypothetical protein